MNLQAKFISNLNAIHMHKYINVEDSKKLDITLDSPVSQYKSSFFLPAVL
jgi:hypothetical protein